MKVLIVGFYTKSFMPYIKKYEDILIAKNVKYDITCFDRDSNGDLSFEGNTYTFHKKMGTIKWKKIIPYFKYIHYVKRIIKEGQYNKLIVLTTVPAVLLNRVLLYHYNQNYIFDYRDYSYEKYRSYKRLVDRIVTNSFCTFISSKGFLHYLNPSEKINIVHNISNIEAMVDQASPIDTQDIIIGFVGYVRYYDVNTALIKCMQGHSDIKIVYYGAMYDDCDLVSYVKDNHFQNVEFYGIYQNDEKPDIYKNMTFINSIYSLDSKEVAYAIPNRLYDAALYKKPIIVAKGTYLSYIVEQYGIGLAVNVYEDNIYELLRDFLNKFDGIKFNENCQSFLDEVMKDDLCFMRKTETFLDIEKKGH